jgi:hypothetical protein
VKQFHQGAPQGVVPVFIPGGALYSYVRISTAGSAWRADQHACHLSLPIHQNRQKKSAPYPLKNSSTVF